ncbi:MAG: cation diffusion facilitator family transporter [Flavobacteriales bacterium]
MRNHAKHNHSLKPHQTVNISRAFWINSGFAILELIGGLLTNSVAILSDALHDFGDSISLGISWALQKRANKAENSRYTYGYHRLSLIGAIINSFILVVGCVFILYKAIERFKYPEEVHTWGMLFLALIGIGVNYWVYLNLKKGTSLNEKVVALHFIEDILGWIAVLIGSVIIKFTNALWIDPLLSVLIAGYILVNVYKNLNSTFLIILQAAPKGVDIKNIENKLNKFEGVISIHDIHCWSLDGEFNIITYHVQVESSTSQEKIANIKEEMREYLLSKNIHHATIEVEYLD